MFDPQFAIREVYAVDSSHQIQLGSVYMGREGLEDQELMAM